MDVRNDEPIDSILKDEFGFLYQASIIASLVGGEDSKDHLSVGISGLWGSGKTSFMKMVKELLSYKQYKDEKEKLEKVLFTKAYYQMSEEKRLKVDQRVIYLWSFFIKLEQEKIEFEDNITNENKVIWFDPWFFGSEESIIKAFFYKIAKEIADEDRTLSNLFIKLSIVVAEQSDLPSDIPVVGEAFEIINVGRRFFSFLTSMFNGNIFNEKNLDFFDIKSKIEERLSIKSMKVFKGYDSDENAIYQFEPRKRIVIIIDDLDRLQTEEAFAMLKVIRLITELSGINVIMGYDERSLTQMLDQKLGGYGKKYIHKMVNIPYIVPVVLTDYFTKNLEGMFFKGKIKDEISKQYGKDISELGLFKVLHNKIDYIREMKRISNLFNILYEIDNNINPVHLLCLILLYTFYFDIYEDIISDKCEFLIPNMDYSFENTSIKNIDFLDIKKYKKNKKYKNDDELLTILKDMYIEYNPKTIYNSMVNYPFGIKNSISIGENERKYYSFLPTEEFKLNQG